MKRIRNTIAMLLAAVILYTLLGGMLTGIFAEDTPINIIVDDYDNGTLRITWNYASARAAEITYHIPNSGDEAEAAPKITVVDQNFATINGLKSDYIYDICVTFYGDVGEGDLPTGDPIGRGLLFFLPSISFKYSAPDQPYTEIPGGGREIGGVPKLKLSWKTPKVFYNPNTTYFPDTDPDLTNNIFTPADTAAAKTYIQGALNHIYGDERQLSTMHYLLNISTKMNLLNSGPDKATIIIDQNSSNESEFTVHVSGIPGVTATVTPEDAQGFRSFELWGRADESSSVDTTQIVSDDILPDPDILPGTVYYMNIKPFYKNDNSTAVPAITVGDNEDQGGSLLMGDRSYASTPIRFQLTKDGANNIYVKIFKINQGSLDLPTLYYEVQSTNLPSTSGDWVVKKTMDDSYFSESSAVTVIQGVNPDNEIFYKIVVKSNNPSDRLESLAMPYTLTADTSRPPLPTGIAITDRTLHTKDDVTLPNTDPEQTTTVKSSDIKISWEKPLNWPTVKDNLYFHFLLSTSQTDTTKQVPIYVNGEQWGDESYSPRYRRVKYISAASSKIKEVGNRLEYTLDGFDLFTWEGDSTDPSIPAPSGDIPLDPDDDDYPKFLLPNTVYYMQMFTTKEEDIEAPTTDKMSDRSIVISFTTLGDVEADVPLPMSFELDANSKDTTTGTLLNYIDLRFDKIMNLDWRNYTSNYNEGDYSYNIYYDLYMNSRTDTGFFPIGTTQVLTDGDVGFTGADDNQSTSIRARISTFTEQSTDKMVECGLLPDNSRTAVTMFGTNLLPNTTYYFKIRTRLVIQHKTDPTNKTVLQSIDTAILPVTTILLDVTPPDDSMRKPLAPTDFQIAVDEGQNQLLTGSSVTFTWLRQEQDVIYQLIRTAGKTNPTAELSEYVDDPEYQSFLQAYDEPSDGVVNDAVYLDPADPTTHLGEFVYDSATDICTYRVNMRMFSNKLYYFALKAVKVDANRDLLDPSSESVWVSIPVTTSLIEAPVSLEVVLGAELGFFWTDITPGLTAEDYQIYVKGPSDGDFKPMTRSQCTIVKDNDGKTYYGRVKGLKTNSYYDVRVVKGTNTLIYEKTAMQTRDGYHELEVKWVGKPLDDYSRYEIAIMAEGESDYTLLSSADLAYYSDKGGTAQPYYIEETARTINSDSLYYHARIQSANVTLPGGLVTKQPLRANVKYYIKVRSVKIDPTEVDFIAYSKFVGPVNTRTEFNQEDYDETDRSEQQEAIFLDKMEALEKGYYWRVAIGKNQTTSILLKGERVADAMRNTSGEAFTVDLTDFAINLDTDEIYLPIDVIRAMNSSNRSLIIRTAGAELMLRPATLNASSNEQIKELYSRHGVKDLYVKLLIERSRSAAPAFASNHLRISDINDLSIQALGLSQTDKAMAELFHDKLYNEETGLVSQKLNMLQNAYVGSGTGTLEVINKYTQSLMDMIEKELSLYIDSTLKSSRLANAVRDIQEFDVPMSANLSHSAAEGLKVPYTLYDGTKSWQRVSSNVVETSSGIRFDLIKTGKFVILAAQSSIGSIPSGHWAESHIRGLASKYDLGEVFTGIQTSVMPDNVASCSELVLLFELVTGKTAENSGLSIRQKNAKLGLDGFIYPNKLVKSAQRQDTAAVLLKLLSVKRGVSMDSLRPGGRGMIRDDRSISDEYYQPVLMIVDIKVMELDELGNFNPTRQMTRAELIAAFSKLLKLTGDL